MTTVFTDKILTFAALMIGGGGLVAFGLFLLFGTWSIVPLSLSTSSAHLLNTALCLLFFLQHSVMIRTRCRTRLCAFIDERRYPAIYAVFSGGVLILFLSFWQKSPDVIYAADGVIYVILRSITVSACFGFLWGGGVMDGFDPLGIYALRKDTRNDPGERQTTPKLFVKGPYRYVRHPLYTCVLMMIWSRPEITEDGLLFNVLFSVWIIVGTYLEEKDLTETFRDAYTDYQAKTPMLFPSIPKRDETSRRS